MANSKIVFKYCALVIYLAVLSGCATVEQWLPQTEDVAEVPTAETSSTSPEPTVVNRFRSSARALSTQQKAWVGTLKSQLDSDDHAGISATLRIMADSLGAGQNEPSMLLVAMGDGAQRIGEQQDALAYWQRAVEINSDNYFAHDRLATHYRTTGDFDLAKTHYGQALSAWPGFTNAYRNRGILFDLYMGDKAAALNDYVRYKQLLEQDGQPTKEVDRWIREMQRAIEQNA
ncbi:tetratricopeptide repeat protein [Alteromonas sp. ASW11-36]|uniref:Tetratricopeptide repeat protein n=1 Tax=Alteromonas arenosi TaxID=3055817 RepID=A0ABT7T0Q4_9ALTE|nr:tetratricopeptide repeat protein [Alteromonas sp. ASW11-36]MDM7862028.1 tetratricopeptide repeat protein [Alteromonas sp. ASW11-36]